MEIIKKFISFLFYFTISKASCNNNELWCDKSHKCINLFENCECEFNDCNLDCFNGYEKDINECNICSCNNCRMNFNDCDDIVCPKIVEISSCEFNSLNSYTTYELSLIINNDNAKNLYAIFGDESNGPQPMIIPPSYQVDNVFGSNLGGISDEILKLSPYSKYDSWLTIGIKNGDLDNKLSTVGIDFNEWSLTNGLNIINGAIFLMNPDEITSKNNEYVVAQLTIPNNIDLNVILNDELI